MPDDLERLRRFLTASAPEYQPWTPDLETRSFDARVAAWTDALRQDLKQQVSGPLRSHDARTRIDLAAVDPRTDTESSYRKAAPRDAACFLDADADRDFEYWILLSRSLIEDLYFILAGVTLGPSRLIQQGHTGLSYVDVRDPEFTVSTEADEPLHLTSVALVTCPPQPGPP